MPANDPSRPGKQAAAAAGATTVDLSSGTVLLDPGSYISSRTASAIVTNTNGAVSNTNVSTFAMIDLEGDTDDGTYIWDLTRDNPGQNDKTGLFLGFYDSANTSRNILAGIYESASSRAVNTSTAGSVSPTTLNTVTRVRVTVSLRTDESGDRVIGPGSVECFNGTTKIDTLDMDASHVVSGTLRKVCAVRRGTAGSPAGDFEYTLTEEFRAP